MAELTEPRLEIATVRGVACAALVAYHVVGPSSVSGMHLPDDSYWHDAMNSLDFLRMPMFSVLSGYLYAAHRVERGALASFFRKKALRLLVPFLFVTAVMYTLRQAVYADGTTVAAAFLFHYQHLWFLQSLMLIFVGIALWDAFARPTWVGLCVAAFGAAMVSRTFEITPFLSLNGAFYLLPFFALGMILRLEPRVLRSADLVVLACSLVVIVMLLQQLSGILGGNSIARLSLPAALCGAAGGFLMLARCPRIRIFETIGAYSFTIYLWHSVCAAAVRHGLAAQMQLPSGIEFLILMIAGLAGPIAVHLIVRRIPVLSLLAAGVRPQHRKSEPSQFPLWMQLAATGALGARLARRRSI